MKNLTQLIKKIKSNGLTLVELLIVIVLVAILGIMAQPTYTRVMAKTDFRNAVEKMAAQIRYTKNMAISDRGTAYTMEFDVDGNSYSVKSVAKDGSTSVKYWYLADDNARANPKIKKVTIEFTTEPNTIRFFPRGLLSSPGEIELKNDYADSALIHFTIIGGVNVKYKMK